MSDLTTHADAESDEDGQNAPAVVAVPVLRRGPGRAPGSPKVPGSGRKKGVDPKPIAELRAEIQTKGRPLEFLYAVAAGRPVRIGPQAGIDTKFVYPNLDQRMKAALALVHKFLPDKSAVELTGENGKDLIPQNMERVSDVELARRIVFQLARAEHELKDANVAKPE